MSKFHYGRRHTTPQNILQTINSSKKLSAYSVLVTRNTVGLSRLAALFIFSRKTFLSLLLTKSTDIFFVLLLVSWIFLFSYYVDSWTEMIGNELFMIYALHCHGAWLSRQCDAFDNSENMYFKIFRNCTTQWQNKTYFPMSSSKFSIHATVKYVQWGHSMRTMILSYHP